MSEFRMRGLRRPTLPSEPGVIGLVIAAKQNIEDAVEGIGTLALAQYHLDRALHELAPDRFADPGILTG